MSLILSILLALGLSTAVLALVTGAAIGTSEIMYDEAGWQWPLKEWLTPIWGIMTQLGKVLIVLDVLFFYPVVLVGYALAKGGLWLAIKLLIRR